jgi:prepilin-type N-terminal cleavage/methylation domain-containing protein
MKKAFTLIELLVVIAIIASLAAILFPVFAQAKLAAKKSVTVSNVKQELLSIAIYINDVDDTYPMAFGARPDGIGTWGSGVVHPVPYNVVNSATWQLPQRYLMAQCFWANATYPYSKNWGILSVPVDITQQVVAADTFLTGVTPATIGLEYNGLFHTLNATSINAPANAVLLWEQQNINGVGRGLSTPVMNCSQEPVGAGALQANAPPCQFNSGDTGATAWTQGVFYVFNFTNPVWIFGTREVYGYADTHAKVGFVGLTQFPAVAATSSAITDPDASVHGPGQKYPQGAPYYYWPCGQGGPTDFGPTFNAEIPCFFRPDRTW